ncbi:hypothetical protein ARMGADRAFT_1037248 [Armillaria gallica]|uniref:Uncharacterized protein n=1 Tax=Armillaria gallica TaxID=47427 RepID=A0A2H3CMN1_ARMGA|nr:hypothetical protein ARMGADRAFT_1037248 [Armillaria gallica]
MYAYGVQTLMHEALEKHKSWIIFDLYNGNKSGRCFCLLCVLKEDVQLGFLPQSQDQHTNQQTVESGEDADIAAGGGILTHGRDGAIRQEGWSKITDNLKGVLACQRATNLSFDQGHQLQHAFQISLHEVEEHRIINRQIWAILNTNFDLDFNSDEL